MELEVGAEELGMADEGFGTGGGQPEGIRDVFQGGGTCGAAFRLYTQVLTPQWDGPWEVFNTGLNGG